MGKKVKYNYFIFDKKKKEEENRNIDFVEHAVMAEQTSFTGILLVFDSGRVEN